MRWDLRILPRTYFPSHAENRMASEGNVRAARDAFLTRRPNNLSFLLQKRYEWMNPYLEGKTAIIELGAGAGFSREFLQSPHLRLTDVEKHPWIDEKVDALAPPYADSSIDAVICSHMIHHVPKPVQFFAEMRRILRPGGLILIQEIETSLMMRALLRAMRHEGWSYDVDVFDPKTVANDPSDPWSANCAIPQLLFREPGEFEKKIPGFKVERNDLGEVLIFPLSGGVIAKSKTINLPKPLLRAIDRIDQILVKTAPDIFALGRSVVLRKI